MISLRKVSCVITAVSTFMTAYSVKADEEADHVALRALVQEYESAIKESDPSVLKPHLAETFSGVMVTGEEIDSFDSLQAYWMKIQDLLGDGGTYRVKVNVPEPATIVGDLAFAHGTTDDTAITSSGQEYEFKGYWTAICQREDEEWKIIRIHGSMDAITNTFVATALKGASTSAGIFGGVAGFVIGGGLFWLLGKRRSIAVSGS